MDSQGTPVAEPLVCLGRGKDSHGWSVVISLPAFTHQFSVEEAKALVVQLNENIERAEVKSIPRPKLRLVQGEGSNLRNDAPTERHLSPVRE